MHPGPEHTAKKKKLLGQLMKMKEDNNIVYILNFLILIIVLWLREGSCFLKIYRIKYLVVKGHSLQMICKV